MLNLISEAWKTSKIKVLMVAIPIVLMLLAAIFLKAYRSWLVASAKRLLQKSAGKDKELAEEAQKANAEASEHKAKADELGKKAEAVKTEEDDLDWNKKL